MENTVPTLGPKHDDSKPDSEKDTPKNSKSKIATEEQSRESKRNLDSETEEETDTEFPDSNDKSGDESSCEETDTDFADPVVYKDKHKIGSRKASEGVITYNEPMYQSLINNMFDTVKGTSPVKRKNSDSSRSKSLNSSPVKRPKIDLERSLSFESAIKVKRKILEKDNTARQGKCEKSPKAAVKKEKKLTPEKISKPKIVNKTTDKKQDIKSEQKGLDLEQKRKNEQERIKSYCKKNLQKTNKKAKKLGKVLDTKTKKSEKGNYSVEKKVKDSITNEKRKYVKKVNLTKPVQKVNTAKTQNNAHENAKEKVPVTKLKPAVPKRRLKREASLNAVTFMNLLYEKEEPSPPKTIDHVAKRSKSETDIQSVVKKQKRHSTPESLAAFQETIDEVVQRIRAENTINEVVERIKSEVVDDAKTVDAKSLKEFDRQKSEESGFSDDVFEKDKFDLIKIKGNIEKRKSQPDKKMVKTPVVKPKKTKKVESRSPEEIAEKKRKANIARIKKAKEILKQGKIRGMKTETDKNEKKLLNMKLSKLSVILKRKQKKQETKEQVKSSKNVLIKKNVKSKDQMKGNQKDKENKGQPKKQKKTETETFRSARTHMESPKRVIRRSSCQCCQSFYQNQGTTFWNNRNVVNRGSYNQDPCPRPSYSQENYTNNVVNRQSYGAEPCPGPSSELPASPSMESHPYSSPTHVPMVDNNTYVGQLVPSHYPQCNSCTCVHGALVSAPCPQCAIGGVPLLACHHQGYSNTYPVTFPHSHGTYSHTCGCTYCSNGSFHPSSSPMIHQTIRADAPYLVHHSVPLQLPHDSSHPMPVQLSHSDRPPAPISHQVSQVSHGDMNSMHLSHVYGVPHNELSSATTVNTLVPMDQDFIDVGEDDLSDISHSTNDVKQRHSSSSDNMKKDNVKKDSAKLLKASSKGVSNKENDVSSNKNSQKIKDSGTKSVKPKQKRLKSTEEQKKKIKAENKSDKTNLKRKRSDEDDKKDCTKWVKRPKIETEVQKASSDNQNVTTKLKDKSKEKAIAKQNITDKQKTTAKPNNALKQTNTTQLKRLDTVNEKDSVKKAKSKEVKKEAKETKKEATEIKKKERKNSGGNKEKVQRSVSSHGWSWEGEPEVRTITGIFDGKQVTRKCYKAIKHDDGDIIQIKDCILVCSGARSRDMPYVAKVTNFWEEPHSGEMMMTLLWYYRPEHTEGGRQPYHKDCEVFAAKHRDESPVACIDDRCYVLTYNEYCRFLAEVARAKYNLPPRDKVVPDPEEPYPCRRIPPVDLDPENVLLCRHVYDFKLKRVLKNPS